MGPIAFCNFFFKISINMTENTNKGDKVLVIKDKGKPLQLYKQ